jgi:hypothetical protein|tara:strand:+ start:119 stop:325 length:207 start_codon:yes stop_codon:yes gene_type:complete
MFKNLKRDRKIKTFKVARKRLDNPSPCCVNGKIEEPTDYLAVIATQKKPKKRMPKMEQMFCCGKNKKK